MLKLKLPTRRARVVAIADPEKRRRFRRKIFFVGALIAVCGVVLMHLHPDKMEIIAAVMFAMLAGLPLTGTRHRSRDTTKRGPQ